MSADNIFRPIRDSDLTGMKINDIPVEELLDVYYKANENN